MKAAEVKNHTDPADHPCELKNVSQVAVFAQEPSVLVIAYLRLWFSF
jgi:hypothetical protein